MTAIEGPSEPDLLSARNSRQDKARQACLTPWLACLDTLAGMSLHPGWHVFTPRQASLSTRQTSLSTRVRPVSVPGLGQSQDKAGQSQDKAGPVSGQGMASLRTRHGQSQDKAWPVSRPRHGQSQYQARYHTQCRYHTVPSTRYPVPTTRYPPPAPRGYHQLAHTRHTHGRTREAWQK